MTARRTTVGPKPKAREERLLLRFGLPPSQLCDVMRELSGTRPEEGELARSPVLTADDAEFLASLGATLRTIVAENPVTPPSLLEDLADYALIEPCPPRSTPERDLITAYHSQVALRRAIAGNPSTPAHVLSRYHDDPVPSVRAALAANPSAPEEVRVLASMS